MRRSAAKGLGYLHWENVATEHLDNLQIQVLEALLKVSSDSEWVVRYGAIVGLEGLAKSLSPQLYPQTLQIQARLTEIASTDEEIAVRARSLLALKLKHG